MLKRELPKNMDVYFHTQPIYCPLDNQLYYDLPEGGKFIFEEYVENKPNGYTIRLPKIASGVDRGFIIKNKPRRVNCTKFGNNYYFNYLVK